MTWTRQGRQHMMGSGNLDTDDLRVLLVRLDALTAAGAVAGATNATPIVIEETAHGRTTGDEVLIVGVAGNTAANGHRTITVTDADHYSLQDPFTGANIVGNGTYTSGGFILPLHGTSLDNYNDVDAGARGGVSATLANTTITDGVFDADDTSVASVAAGDDIWIMFLILWTGTESTTTILKMIQSGDFPLTPDGNNVNITWDNGANRISRLVG